jgi:hypothetical protein
MSCIMRAKCVAQILCKYNTAFSLHQNIRYCNGKLKLRDENLRLVLRRLPFVLGIYPYNLADLLRQVHDDTLVFGELH